jgi:hypothetical protein
MSIPDTITGIKVQKPSEVAQSVGVFLTICGPPDVGKTVMCSYAQDSPYGAPVAWIDVEAGVRSIVHRDDIAVLEVDHWSKLTRLIDSFKRECPFQSLVFDNISEGLELALDALTLDEPSREHYKTATSRLIGAVHGLKAIARKGTNVFIIGWENDIRDKDGTFVKTTIALNPKSAQRFGGTVDALAHMQFTSDFNVRVLNFQSGPGTDARFRRGRIEGAAQVPLKIPHRESDRVICDLLATMRGGAPWPADKYNKPTKKET